MELYDAMRSLRAVRRLRPDPIPDEVLQRIFTAATWAPSGGNRQPWRIIAVHDAAKKQALEDLYLPLWNDYARAHAEDRELPPKVRRTLAAGDYLARHMHEAPVIAVFCFDPTGLAVTDHDLPRQSVVGGGSLYPAVQNLLLACRNEGIGCVLTTLLCMVEPAVKALLEIPENWHTYAYVPMGYAVGAGHGPINRRPAGQMVFTDRWQGDD